jgi:prefoldin subunit 5
MQSLPCQEPRRYQLVMKETAKARFEMYEARLDKLSGSNEKLRSELKLLRDAVRQVYELQARQSHVVEQMNSFL